MWSSARDWTANERQRLDDYLEQAKLTADAKRVLPGVPALIGISNGGDRRRKRKVAWAVMAGGAAKEEDKLRVTCAEPEVLEVSRHDVRPIQVGVRSVLLAGLIWAVVSQALRLLVSFVLSSNCGSWNGGMNSWGCAA